MNFNFYKLIGIFFVVAGMSACFHDDDNNNNDGGVVNKPDIAVVDSVNPSNDLKIPFGNVTLGSTSSKTITIINRGRANLVIGSIAVANPLAAPFSKSSDNCSGQTLTASTNCTLTIRFAPSTETLYNDSFDIPSNDPDVASITFAVSGSGTLIQVADISVTDSVSPTNDLQIPFGSVTVGGTSDKTITITNNGGGTLSLGNIASTNPLTLPFSVLVDNCSGMSLGTSDNCTLTIRFAPLSAGSFSDAFNIPSNDPDQSNLTFNVNGTGADVQVTIPAAPTSPAISNITTSSATLSWLDNSNNESGFEIIRCDGLQSLLANNQFTCLTNLTVIKTVAANVRSTLITGLAAGTNYAISVRSYNSAGHSDDIGIRFTTTTAQQTVTFQAIATNVVESNSLDSSWANTAYPNTYPAVGIQWYSGLLGPNSLAFAGLVKFNVASLTGKTIDSATLNLETNLAPVGYATQNFKIAAIATNWSTSTVTWNQMSSFLYYTSSWQTYAYPTYSGQIYNINLTSTVQFWANGSYLNYGLGFLSTNYGVYPGNITSFDAYEFVTPTLTVTYH